MLVLAQQYRGDVVRQVNRKAITLSLLKVEEDVGKNVAWAFETSGAVARYIPEGADTTVFAGDAQSAAVLSWAIVESPIYVSNLMVDAAASSGTPEGNVDTWARQAANSCHVAASLINVDLFQGDGTDASSNQSIVGFDTIISATTAYAGVTRTGNAAPLINGNVFDPGTPTKPSLNLIRQDLASIYVASGHRPDLALCSPAVFNTIVAQFDSSTRYEVETVNVAKGAVKLDGGRPAVSFDGCFFVEDKDAVGTSDTSTVGSIYYVNTDFTSLRVLPPANVPQQVKQSLRANDGFDDLLLNFKFERLAKLGASERARLEATVQLRCTRPNALGVRRNVAVLTT